jgi:hypothetical protein
MPRGMPKKIKSRWLMGGHRMVAYEGTNAVCIFGQEEKEIACRRR